MQPVFPIAPHFQLTLVRLLFYFPGIPAIQQVFHTMDLRNFLYFFDLIVQSLVVSMRFDITDNSQGNREFRSTCVGLRYGYSTNNSGFSWQLAHTFPYFSSVCITSSDYRADLPTLLLPRLPRDSIPASALPLRPHSSVILQYRNFNLLSIDYVFRPRLRSRLTQGRSALLWKPWVFGRKDSHLPLATHSGILSS